MHNMSAEQHQQQQQQQQVQHKRLQHQQHLDHIQQQQQQQQQHHKMCKENMPTSSSDSSTTAVATNTTRASPTTATAVAVATTTSSPPPPLSATSAGGGTAATAAATVGAAATAATPRKTSPHEMRNSEFVSRLMAATPPYLYSAPVGPNNFFFSDMLRSLVQARNNENMRNLQLQQSIIARRSRKRSWSAQHRPAGYTVEHMREGNKASAAAAALTAMPMTSLPPHQLALAQQQQQHQQQQLDNCAGDGNSGGRCVEKPLELTNKTAYYHSASKYRKLHESSDEAAASAGMVEKKLKHTAETHVTPIERSAQPTIGSGVGGAAGGGAVDSVLQDTPPAASLPPQDLVLPPPPIWYPPHLYPPYGIDPLHFFIDLRVSSHIYDRKKENLSPLTPTANAENNNNNNSTSNNNESMTANQLGGSAMPLQLPQKYRQGSAFSVPVPRGAAASERCKLSGGTHNGGMLMASGGGATAGGGGGGGSASAAAINLSSKFEHYAKYYDFGEDKEKENQPAATTPTAMAPFSQPPPQPTAMTANYMLQQLPRLYSQFAAGQAVAAVAHAAHAASDGDGDGDNKSEPDCDGDSDVDGGGGGGSGDVDAFSGGGSGGIGERDIDVEFIDSIQRSIKYHRRTGFHTTGGVAGGGSSEGGCLIDGDDGGDGGGGSSRCSSADESSITQID